MSSSHPKEARMSEPLPCPECGEVQMIQTVETCRLADEFTVRNLKHFKCRSCGSRYFDDEAMHRIQSARASKAASSR